jgi:hypothetical protein
VSRETITEHQDEWLAGRAARAGVTVREYLDRVLAEHRAQVEQAETDNGGPEMNDTTIPHTAWVVTSRNDSRSYPGIVVYLNASQVGTRNDETGELDGADLPDGGGRGFDRAAAEAILGDMGYSVAGPWEQARLGEYAADVVPGRPPVSIMTEDRA